MWDCPGQGVKSMFPALAGGFLTTELPGKPWLILFKLKLCCTKNIRDFNDSVGSGVDGAHLTRPNAADAQWQIVCPPDMLVPRGCWWKGARDQQIW